MKRILGWAGLVLAGLVAVAVLVVAGVIGVSEFALRKTYPKREMALTATQGPAAVARGERLARLYGCHDCHGEDLAGRLFFDEMPLARVSGANLTLAVASQSDGDLAQAIRHGVDAQGRGLWIMPSEAFLHFTDAETADILAYLRTFKPKGEPRRTVEMGPVARIGAVLGQIKPAAGSPETPPLPEFGRQYAQGRDLARACTECHGAELQGSATVKSPDLIVAAAYDPADFERLLRTGIAAGGRRLGLMSEIAPARFNVLSQEEIAALHAYLRARAEAAPPV